MRLLSLVSLFCFVYGLLLSPLAAIGADQPAPTEADYYPMFALPIPEEVVLEGGALEWMPSGKLAVASRRGEIWLVENPLSDNPSEIKFTRFASGLHEVLGLAERDGWLYVTQRPEISRLKDTDGDGRADLFETVSDAWGINGDYHEYAFGSKFDRDGNLWVVLCLTGSFNSNTKFRGWALRVSPDGKTTPTTSGIRSPGGIGMNAAGEMFYTDNQGPWNGACKLQHLVPGRFVGHPAGNRWYDLAPELGRKPQEPASGGRLVAEAEKIPELLPPAVYFPYPKMGQSSSGVVCDLSGGKFGPFDKQMFVGDQSQSFIARVMLEKVNGDYQGACIPLRYGFSSGCLAMLQAPSGAMFVEGTSRGWGARGGKEFSLERIVWSGKRPFELLEMHVRTDGFELSFTEPLEAASAVDLAAYKLSTYTYIYQSSYGSPEVDQTTPTIERVELSADQTTARLFVKGLQLGHVHELHLDGVRSAGGLPLLHNTAYYTLFRLPK